MITGELVSSLRLIWIKKYVRVSLHISSFVWPAYYVTDGHILNVFILRKLEGFIFRLDKSLD